MENLNRDQTLYSINKEIMKEFWGEIYFNEIFIPISSEAVPEIDGFYMISNYGKIYNLLTHKRVNYSINYSNANKGNKINTYYSAYLKTFNGYKGFRVHRLVMACFYPELGNIHTQLDINHKDGDGSNNYISYNNSDKGNIEWLTHRDNMLHAYRTGLHQTGEDNVHSKITNDQAKEIIELLALNKYTAKEIIEIMNNPTNVTTHIIDDIKKKQCWTHLSEGYDFYQRPWRQFTEHDIHNICKFFQDNPKPENKSINDHCRDALEFCGFERDDRYVETIRKLYKKKYYKHIVSQYNY